ncbi:MAG: hypothetical protein K0S04_1552 [Herbinix sp.]|jgi:hypothetical protein|nr:hypothetical protein [Herbinix sp.]
MGADIYIIKVSKIGFLEKLKSNDIKSLTGDDIQGIKEDEISSFINVFERYFEKNEISYEVGNYLEITSSELASMIRYLERRLSLACDKTDWYFRMSEEIFNKLEEWKDKSDDSIFLFKQDIT